MNGTRSSGSKSSHVPQNSDTGAQTLLQIRFTNMVKVLGLGMVLLCTLPLYLTKVIQQSGITVFISD